MDGEDGRVVKRARDYLVLRGFSTTRQEELEALLEYELARDDWLVESSDEEDIPEQNQVQEEHTPPGHGVALEAEVKHLREPEKCASEVEVEHALAVSSKPSVGWPVLGRRWLPRQCCQVPKVCGMRRRPLNLASQLRAQRLRRELGCQP
jgi:hypothetical protein